MIRQPFSCYNSIYWAITRHAQHFSRLWCRDDMSSFLAMSSWCHPKKNSNFYRCCLISFVMSDDMLSKFLWISRSDNILVDMSSKFLGRMTCSAKCHSWQYFVNFDDMSQYLAKIYDISRFCLGHFSIFGQHFSAISQLSEICHPTYHVVSTLSEMFCHIDIARNMW